MTENTPNLDSLPPVGEADVAAGLAEVRDGIRRAAEDSERDPASVHLVAVSKTVPVEGILPALEAGQRIFGENYVQESKAKWPALRERFPDVELHLVGPLQVRELGADRLHVERRRPVADRIHGHRGRLCEGSRVRHGPNPTGEDGEASEGRAPHGPRCGALNAPHRPSS